MRCCVGSHGADGMRQDGAKSKLPFRFRMRRPFLLRLTAWTVDADGCLGGAACKQRWHIGARRWRRVLPSRSNVFRYCSMIALCCEA